MSELSRRSFLVGAAAVAASSAVPSVIMAEDVVVSVRIPAILTTAIDPEVIKAMFAPISPPAWFAVVKRID